MLAVLKYSCVKALKGEWFAKIIFEDKSSIEILKPSLTAAQEWVQTVIDGGVEED